jgi:hypothetical protein
MWSVRLHSLKVCMRQFLTSHSSKLPNFSCLRFAIQWGQSSILPVQAWKTVMRQV